MQTKDIYINGKKNTVRNKFRRYCDKHKDW